MSSSSPSSRRLVKIDIISDFLCAWSYIGHNALEKSLARVREANLPIDFSIRYHPYLLASSVYLSENEPIPTTEFYKRKIGPEKYQSIVDMVVGRAAQEGLHFKFDGNVRQTTRAHRVTLKAYRMGGQAVQLALVKRLFRSFFEEAQDIGDEDTLAEICCAPDVMLFTTVNEARDWILGDELSDIVRTLSEDATRKGIKGVPFIVIDNRWALTGCQKTECFFKIFEKLATSDPHEPPCMTLASSISATKSEGKCVGESCSAEFAVPLS